MATMRAWRGKVAEIAAAEASYAAVESSQRLETVDTLVDLAGDDDPIVGFAAKEALAKLLSGNVVDPIHSMGIVRHLLEEGRDPHGFRLALLRQLIHGNEDDTSNEKSSSGSDDVDDDRVEPSDVFLDAVLHEVELLEARVVSVFKEPSADPQQYEALAFLSDLLRQVGSKYGDSATPRFVPLLCGFTRHFIEATAGSLNYQDAPLSVTCGVLNVLYAWHELVLPSGSSIEKEGDGYVQACVSCSIQWLATSSCTSVALSMINSNEDEAEAASENAFIGRQNRFPFLQKWLQVLGRIATSVVDTLDCWEDNQPVDQLYRWLDSVQVASAMVLPSRQSVLAILSEQDDVMVQVLDAITYTFVKMEQRGSVCSDSARLVIGMLAEFDPDLLFSDLLSAFAFDHLVLLDFLTSSETVMLAFLLRYLRRLMGRWSTSRRLLLESGRLDQVMSTLIRLRLEVGRLVTADLFPYDPTPLVRRLEMVEDAYEAVGTKEASV